MIFKRMFVERPKDILMSFEIYFMKILNLVRRLNFERCHQK